ncbi:tegument protein UL25 [Panine betaherpesvirus 2]|uniref:Tegument protein UL25 n=1 Tax=Panine betaherpesvirus 2 TaxID=188763 RepID=Q8QS63_9BETA|nr:tegument protein UL25 [Panine betaherpesvirus 2]AAM00675.1 tegument protein UL25 [Panine betaherpesvirus 2]QXV67777.1 tegument protein UL25 [Panine betaherpesvirus 2]
MSSRRRSSSRRNGEHCTVIYIPSSDEDVFVQPRSRNGTEDLDRMEAGLSSYSASSDTRSSFEFVKETAVETPGGAHGHGGSVSGTSLSSSSTPRGAGPNRGGGETGGGRTTAGKPSRRSPKIEARPTSLALATAATMPATPSSGRMAKSPKVSQPPSFPSLTEEEDGAERNSGGDDSSHTDNESSGSDPGAACGPPVADSEFSFCDSDIEDFEHECRQINASDNLGFHTSVVSPHEVDFIKFVLTESSLQHVASINACVPMPAFALASLVDPVFRNVSPGERDLTRYVVLHAVFINYYYQALGKARHMDTALENTLQSPTVRQMVAHADNQTRAGRATALALHFLRSDKPVTDGQYLACLRRLDDELRRRGTVESPKLTEVYETLRDYNVLFSMAHYTTRGALYLYRQNLQKLNDDHQGALKLLSGEQFSTDHTLNDLAFLVGIELMVAHFRRTIRALRCYIQHQLQTVSELAYFIYLQLPSLRNEYLELMEILYWASSRGDDQPLFMSTGALFDFLRYVRNQDAFICTDYVRCALRLMACPDREAEEDDDEDSPGPGDSYNQRVGQFMIRDRLLRDPNHSRPRDRLLTRDLCLPRMQARPTHRHTPVEHVCIPNSLLTKTFTNPPPEEREEDTLRALALKAFMDRAANHSEPQSQHQQHPSSPPPGNGDRARAGGSGPSSP